jgi:hypothetical protein
MKCEEDYKPDLYIKKRIGRESVNAQVFIACDKNHKCDYVFKKMPLDLSSIESLYKNYCLDNKISNCDKNLLNPDEVYKYHNDSRVMIHSSWVEIFVLNLCNVLLQEKICFNLPLTHKYSFCNNCNYNNQIINCAMVVTDFFDEGDLQGWLVKKDRSPLELFAMFFQVFAGLYALRKYFNVIHNDMHAGNVLVKKINNPPNSFLRYSIDGQEYFIPNTGYVFIIWDFGYAQIPKFIEIVNYAKLRENDKKLYKSIDVIDYTRITSVILHFLPEKYKLFKNIVKFFILNNSKKGITLENILKIFANYKKPSSNFTLFESCSFDKNIPKFDFKPLYKYRYKTKKQYVNTLPYNFLFANNLESLKNYAQKFNVKDFKLQEFDKKIIKSIYPPLPKPKTIKSNIKKNKRTIDAIQDTLIRSKKKSNKANNIKPMSLDLPFDPMSLDSKIGIKPMSLDLYSGPKPMSLDLKNSKSKKKYNIWNIFKKFKK